MKRKLLNALALGVFGVMGITAMTSCTNDETETVNYTVTFETNGASAIEQRTIEAGNRVSNLPTPTKTGYAFEGWYTDEACSTGKEFTATSIITGNTTLYAKWIETYTVSYNTNGGSTLESTVIKKGSAISNLPTPTRAGYAFIGWYSDSTLSTEFTSSTVVNGNLTLYAAWTDNLTYEEFMSKEVGDNVVVTGYIAAKQAWWNNSAVMYLVDSVGYGYFVYGVNCTEEEYNTKFTIGTYVKVEGEKAIYAGEHEINSGAKATVIETSTPMPQTPYDISGIIGDNDKLMAHQNAYFTATLTVKAYNEAGDAYAFADSAATPSSPSGDLYFKLTDGTNDLACVIESYLTGTSTDVYKAVMALEVGQTVVVEGFLYWWEGANPHITSLSVVETPDQYTALMNAEDGADVSVKGYIAAKQDWWNNSAVMYLVDSVGYGYFVYGVNCTEEEYNNKYTIGTYVKVDGKKTSYAGEHEINKGATATVLETNIPMPTHAISITNLIGDNDKLMAHQNAYFTATLTVKAYNEAGDAYAFADASATPSSPNGDLYFKLTDGTNDLACVIESYLTGKGTDVYKAVMALEVGQTVVVEGFLYWWEGANPHITSIVVC